MIVLTAALGIGYPLAVTGIGQIAFPHQADGSTISRDGETVGSSLIGQSFTGRNGRPLTQWFQSRPSAAGGAGGYDADDSAGSNSGPNSPALAKAIGDRRTMIEDTYRVRADQVPADAVTASGSGLDPDISLAYADLQVAEVARTRGISAASVQKLVRLNTHGRDLGYLGEPVANVVELNLDLSAMDPAGNGGNG